MKTKLNKLRNLSNKAKEDLETKLNYAGFKNIQDYLNYIHFIDDFESYHTLDDVLCQLDYYVNIQRKILIELEGI